MFHKNIMGSIIRSSGTIIYSLLYLNSRIGFNELKYLYSVISVIDKRLPGNTKKWTIAPFVDGHNTISPSFGGPIYLDVNIYTYTYVYIYTYTYTYIYTYTYLYIYMHIYICINEYISMHRRRRAVASIFVRFAAGQPGPFLRSPTTHICTCIQMYIQI